VIVSHNERIKKDMKSIIKTTILFLLLVIISSCEKNNDPITEQNIDIFGVWINPEYSDNEIKFERSKKLLEDDYGISFLSEHIFLERHSGWCGTPPLVFSNYQGTWEKKDMILEINLDNGMKSFIWKIKTINADTLIVEKME